MTIRMIARFAKPAESLIFIIPDTPIQVALATDQPESSAQDANSRQNNNTPGNSECERTTNNPYPVVTINIAHLQAIKQTIADLEEAAQRNLRCRRRSKSELVYKYLSKCSNLSKSQEKCFYTPRLRS